MSDNQLINTIRASRKLNKLYNKMTVEQKRRLIATVDDTWHIEQIMKEILEDKNES